MSLPCGGDRLAVQTLVDLAVELETVGWDGVFLEDYLVHYRGDDPTTYDPWLVLAAVAGRTSTITLGTGVTGLLARDPVKLAREALTLRDLSDGRVVLGVGWATRVTAVRASTRCGTRSDLVVSRWTNGSTCCSTSRAARSAFVEGARATARGCRRAEHFSPPVWVGGSSQAGVVARRAD